jgi:hypothetical protein
MRKKAVGRHCLPVVAPAEPDTHPDERYVPLSCQQIVAATLAPSPRISRSAPTSSGSVMMVVSRSPSTTLSQRLRVSSSQTLLTCARNSSFARCHRSSVCAGSAVLSTTCRSARFAPSCSFRLTARCSASVDRFVKSLAMTMLVMLCMAYTRKRDLSIHATDAMVDRPVHAVLTGLRSFRSIKLSDHKQDRSSLICIKAGPPRHLHLSLDPIEGKICPALPTHKPLQRSPAHQLLTRWLNRRLQQLGSQK